MKLLHKTEIYDRAKAMADQVTEVVQSIIAYARPHIEAFRGHRRKGNHHHGVIIGKYCTPIYETLEPNEKDETLIIYEPVRAHIETQFADFVVGHFQGLLLNNFIKDEEIQMPYYMDKPGQSFTLIISYPASQRDRIPCTQNARIGKHADAIVLYYRKEIPHGLIV